MRAAKADAAPPAPPQVDLAWLPPAYVSYFLTLAKSTPHEAWRKRRSGLYFQFLVLTLPPELKDFELVQPSHKTRLFLLRCPEGSQISPHVDQSASLLLQRIVMLQPALEGGVLTVEDVPYPLRPGDACLFDANRQLHFVTQAVRGDRYVLAVGTYGKPGVW